MWLAPELIPHFISARQGGTMMSAHCLVMILSLIFPLTASIVGQASSDDGGGLPLGGTIRRDVDAWQVGSNINGEGMKVQQKNDSSASTCDVADLNDQNRGTADHLKSTKGGKSASLFRRLHPLSNVHGVLNMLGWGTMLPAGVIVARFFRRSPLECEEWYKAHTLCQTVGYIVGAVGWGTGLSLGNSNFKKDTSFKAQEILGILAFTLATIQMFALCWQPKGENAGGNRRWEIYHQILGYALIAMIVASIFDGIGSNQKHPQIWRWTYVGILGALILTALALEIFRYWIKLRTNPHYLPNIIPRH